MKIPENEHDGLGTVLGRSKINTIINYDLLESGLKRPHLPTGKFVGNE